MYWIQRSTDQSQSSSGKQGTQYCLCHWSWLCGTLCGWTSNSTRCTCTISLWSRGFISGYRLSIAMGYPIPNLSMLSRFQHGRFTFRPSLNTSLPWDLFGIIARRRKMKHGRASRGECFHCTRLEFVRVPITFSTIPRHCNF